MLINRIEAVNDRFHRRTDQKLEIVRMRDFQETLNARRRSFISSICMTAPLNLSRKKQLTLIFVFDGIIKVIRGRLVHTSLLYCPTTMKNNLQVEPVLEF